MELVVTIGILAILLSGVIGAFAAASTYGLGYGDASALGFSTFDGVSLGGNAVFFSNYNRNSGVSGSQISELNPGMFINYPDSSIESIKLKFNLFAYFYYTARICEFLNQKLAVIGLPRPVI